MFFHQKFINSILWLLISLVWFACLVGFSCYFLCLRQGFLWMLRPSCPGPPRDRNTSMFHHSSWYTCFELFWGWLVWVFGFFVLFFNLVDWLVGFGGWGFMCGELFLFCFWWLVFCLFWNMVCLCSSSCLGTTITWLILIFDKSLDKVFWTCFLWFFSM